MRNGKRNISLIGLFSIVTILVALIVVVISFVIRYNNLNQINERIRSLGNSSKELELVESSIQKLHEVDNNFRVYTINYEKEYRTNYLNGLKYVVSALDSLKSTTGNSQNQIDNLKSTFADKINLDANYLKIKLLVDSIYSVDNKIDMTLNENKVSIERDFNRLLNLQKEIKISIDTVSSQSIIQTKKTPGIIGKLFGSKETTQIQKGVILKKESSSDPANQESTASNNENSLNDVIKDIQNEYARQYKAKISGFVKNQKLLQQNEKALILKNMNLLFELQNILDSFKSYYAEVLYNEKENAVAEVNKSIKKISNAALASFLLILALAALILLNLRAISKTNKKLEIEKQRAVDEANAKERFLAYMSHELRTPLFTISGFIEQLKYTLLSNEQMKFLGITQQSVDTLLLTINDILDHSSLSKAKQRFVPIEFTAKHLLFEIKASFEPLFENKGINFEVNTKGEENLVMLGDTFRLKQVFNNLISNALKYTEKGTVIVECRVDQFGDKGFLHGKVADTGIGIRKDKMNELFEEYTQLYDSKANWRLGTGLGLSICKKIVEQQGGRVWATSEEGKGSVFSFEIEFPVNKLPSKEFTETVAEFDISKLRGIKALFIDDNKINIMLIKAMIAKWGLEYDTAEDGIEGLKLIDEKPYDIIFTDIYMPNMNGVELVKRIRSLPDKSKSTLPVIAITANIMQKDVDSYKESGMTDNLFKPFKSLQLYNIMLKYRGY